MPLTTEALEIAYTVDIVPRHPHVVEIPEKFLEHCAVKAKTADELSREEISSLMNWCDWQRESLWDGMNLQEILNVYRVSAQWESWESWEQEDPAAAVKAWNRVVREKNHLIPAK